MPTTRGGTVSSPNDTKSPHESLTNTNGKRAAGNTALSTPKRSKTKNDHMQQMTLEKTLENAISTPQGSTEVAKEHSLFPEVNKKNCEVDGDNKIKEPAIQDGQQGIDIDSNNNRTENDKNREQDIEPELDSSRAEKDFADKEDNAETKRENVEEHGVAPEDQVEALLSIDEVIAEGTEIRDFAQETRDGSLKPTASSEPIIEDEQRAATMPSSILEKGVIYFFFRSRVNVENPQGVEDVARSYIVLRPLPIGSKLGEGPLQDDGNARLLALPKKILPVTHKDRFLVFVENGKASIKELKDIFISASDYATKTAGTSHVPAATPVAEGVYAITSTGRESHLAYIISSPELGEVQKELGLKEQGSYVVSAKNPKYPAPGTAPGKMAEYPEEITKEFRDLRWMPLKPELLDYENTQFLIIGEGMGDINSAMQEMSCDQKDGEKEAPIKEMEKLEDEDQIRIEHLKDNDPIFADLGLSSKEYPKTQTTW